jgi:hypothetical protein
MEPMGSSESSSPSVDQLLRDAGVDTEHIDIRLTAVEKLRLGLADLRRQSARDRWVLLVSLLIVREERRR